MQPINAANIPEELKARKSWVMWKYLIRHGQKTKVLYQATGAEAKSNDPSTWTDFATVMARYAAGNWEGIGYVFSPDDPYTGVDLDGCRNPDTKIIEPWAKEIISKLDTYAEVSPSLSGVKMWVRAKWPDGAGHNVKLPEMPKVSDKTPGIEAYDWGRFFTVTGVVVQGFREIRDNQEAIEELRHRFFKSASAPLPPSDFRSQSSIVERARRYIAKLEPAVSGQNGHDRTFHAACVLVKGFALSEDDAYGLLCEWNKTHCQPEWSERDLVRKVDQAYQQPGECGYLRNANPSDYQRIPMPHYKTPSEVPEPEPEKSSVTMTLMDDAARKALAAVKADKTKLIDLGLPDLDHALGGGVAPGEMIIFAARPSHGKSMAAQQVIHNLTEIGIPAVMVSEEMSHLQLGQRVLLYASDIPDEHWKTQSVAVGKHIDQHFKDRAPCYILEGCRSVDRVAVEIRKYVKECGAGLAVVDYAQLLTGKGSGRYEDISYVSQTLKKVFQECNIPGIVLCQMSRSIEHRRPFMPVMSDIKETGQFEQDADVIVFQVWPHRLDPDQDPSLYQLFIAKNRNRPINAFAIECKFIPGRQRLVYTKAANVPAKAPTLKDYDVFEPSDTDGDF